jgi:hypothetical protein
LVWVFSKTRLELHIRLSVNNLAQYSWLGTILYMGILAGEFPQNFLLQKLPVAKFLAVK